MNNELFDLMKKIENLSDDDLVKVKTWIEFNLLKRKCQQT